MKRHLLQGAAMMAILLGAVAPSRATTLIRQSLDSLVAGNATVVVGEVVDAHSYWNDEHTFILTDIRIKAAEVLKGDRRETELTVTLMGGSVDDLTTLIVAGAQLIPGRSYLMFLNEDDVPGVRQVLTVRHHAQGVFDVVRGRDGWRAISQANRHPLVPDALGFVDPPGGGKGLLLDAMKQSIREIAARQGGLKEVQ